MADPLPLTDDDAAEGSWGRARALRELLVLASALLLGLLLIPLLIDLVGARTLGPYAGGNLQGFLEHFYRGLGSGSPGFWMVALGPYVIMQLARGLWALRR